MAPKRKAAASAAAAAANDGGEDARDVKTPAATDKKLKPSAAAADTATAIGSGGSGGGVGGGGAATAGDDINDAAALYKLMQISNATNDMKQASSDEWQKKFSEIARVLLTQCVLQVTHATSGVTKSYRLCEVEAYYKSDTGNYKFSPTGGDHYDTFSHGNPLQLSSCGHFYFHRAGASQTSAYRAGSYKGLDITFGEENRAYGGFLIRAIEPLLVKDNRYTTQKGAEGKGLVEGPCKSVDTILADAGATAITDLVGRLQSLNAFDSANAGALRVLVVPAAERHTNPTSIISAPRVGLTLKMVSVDRLYYINANYRWISAPTYIKVRFPSVWCGHVLCCVVLRRRETRDSECGVLMARFDLLYIYFVR